MKEMFDTIENLEEIFLASAGIFSRLRDPGVKAGCIGKQEGCLPKGER
jgi:hypothetical protein